MSNEAVPQDIVVVACIVGAYGVRGQIKLKIYNPSSSILSSVRQWWLRMPGSAWKKVRAVTVKLFENRAVVCLDDLNDRDEARSLKGGYIGISRSQFPRTDDGEYYWVDLYGMKVVNLQQEFLGTINEIFDTGANVVLRVKRRENQSFPILPEKSNALPVGSKEILIPFIDKYIVKIDQLLRRVIVDWGWDY